MTRSPVDVYERKLKAIEMRDAGLSFDKISEVLGRKQYRQRDIDRLGWFDMPLERQREYSERKQTEHRLRT